MRLFLLSLLAGVLVASCSTSTDPEPGLELLTVGTVSSSDLTVTVLSERPLEAGYNTVFLRLERGGTSVSDAHIELAPLMDMGLMKHSCPVEQPSSMPNADDLFTGAVIFTMAGSADQWTLNMQVHDHETSTKHDLSLPITVAASPYVSVKKDGMRKTIITLVRSDWRTGMNDVQFIVHRTMDGYTFDPIESLTTTIEPTMPSMDHGSEGNVDPVHIHDGWYEGRVNFTMTGEWDLALDLFTNEELMTATNFLVEVR